MRVTWSTVRAADNSLSAPNFQPTNNSATQERDDQCGNHHFSHELLMMGIVMPEIFWAYKKYNKIISGILLVLIPQLFCQYWQIRYKKSAVISRRKWKVLGTARMKVNASKRSVDFLRPHCRVERKNTRKRTQGRICMGLSFLKKSLRLCHKNILGCHHLWN